MSFPKSFRQIAPALVVGLVVAVIGVGFGFTSASAAVPGQLEASNLVVEESACGVLSLSFAYVGGPDDWYARQDADNGGPTIASGSVSTPEGDVSDVVLGQPAGTYDITLYRSGSDLPIARTSVTVPAYDSTTCGQIEATNFVVTQPSCGKILFSFDYVGGPDTWFAVRHPQDTIEEGLVIATGSVSTANGTVSNTAISQPAGTYDILMYGSRGGKPFARGTVTVGGCGQQIDATNFVVTQPSCETISLSFDYDRGPGEWVVMRSKSNVYEPSVLIASGSVANAAGSVSNIVVTGQPAGRYDIALLSSNRLKAIEEAMVTVDACVATPTVTSVTPTPPTFTDKTGTTDDTYTVPSKVGVEYLVAGVVKASSTYPGTGSVTITTAPKSGYVLVGTTAWTFQFTDAVTAASITPTPPTFTDKAGAADDTYTVPSMVGVEYLVAGVVTAAGIYPGTGTVTITAAPKSGYLLSGTTAWTFRYTNVVPTQATTPPTTNNSPVVALAAAGGQPALNPGFGAKTGWGEDTSTQRDNTLIVALLLAMAGLSGLAYDVRRKAGE